MLKIVVFGLGKLYRDYKETIDREDEIVAYLDNNSALWSTKIDGIDVHNPCEIIGLEYDKIILLSTAAYQMKKQLLSFGCREEDILHYQEYFGTSELNPLKFYPANEMCNDAKGRILVITTPVGYHGGALAACYLSMAMRKKGYEVAIAAWQGEEEFISEMQKKGVSFLVSENLLRHCVEESFISEYDYIIVNTFPMIREAVEIAKRRKIIFWLHESNNVYNENKYWVEWMNKSIKEAYIKNIYFCAVSERAKENFESNIHYKCEDILEYGIPDERCLESKKNGKIVFGNIANVVEHKGQDILLDAIGMLDKCQQEKCEFLFIGKEHKDAYNVLIKDKAKGRDNIIFLGDKKRTDMLKLFSHMNVFVVASREETMSIVATEALMCEKVCIVPDTAGISKYIKPYYNGLIYHCGDIYDLKDKMEWCIQNMESIKAVGKKARETYEDLFTLQKFSERVDKILQEIV